jgi:hypothetical protein
MISTPQLLGTFYLSVSFCLSVCHTEALANLLPVPPPTRLPFCDTLGCQTTRACPLQLDEVHVPSRYVV